MDYITRLLSSPSFPPFTLLSALIDNAFLFALLIFCALWLVQHLIKDSRRTHFVIFVVLLSSLCAITIKELAKEPRICAIYPSKIPCPTDYALPSTHAAAAFALCISLLGTSLYFPSLAFALLISFSRIYLGVHSLADVCAGLALALLSYYASLMLWHAFAAKKPENTVSL